MVFENNILLEKLISQLKNNFFKIKNMIFSDNIFMLFSIIFFKLF